MAPRSRAARRPQRSSTSARSARAARVVSGTVVWSTTRCPSPLTSHRASRRDRRAHNCRRSSAMAVLTRTMESRETPLDAPNSASVVRATSSSRTGPSALVTRRTAFSSARPFFPRATTGSASRRRRVATRASCTAAGTHNAAAGRNRNTRLIRCNRIGRDRFVLIAFQGDHATWPDSSVTIGTLPPETPHMRLAAIDIGTNSIHMIVVNVRADLSFEVIDQEKAMVRLGAGGLDGRMLTTEAMTAALQALSKFRLLAESHGVEKVLATATSAVREAKNGGDFLGRIASSTGIRARVISGIEEARLIHLAAMYGVDVGSARAVVIDIGGGSVEITHGSVSTVQASKSFKLGAIRLT